MPGKHSIKKWKILAFYFSIVAMLAGLFFSRALLSLGMIAFAIISLIHGNILQQLKTFFTSPFLWAMSLLFVLPMISGFWSEDLSQWSQVVRIKLPLLLLPLCFSGESNFLFRDWQRVAFVFLLLVFGGVCWSLCQYAQHLDAIHAAYLKAYTIETPLGNDHVRFSLLVVIAILTIVFLIAKSGRNFKKLILVFLFIVAAVNVIYLHVLAVRTGLICFYVGMFGLVVLSSSRSKSMKSFFLILIFSLPVAAYFIFPTFRNKIHYLKYDLSFVQKDIYLPGSSDGNRVASIKAGWTLLNQEPFAGVGFGDIKNETEKFYQATFPQMSQKDRILPSSEWMIYGSGTGCLGLIVFSFVMLVPFFIKGLRRNVFWVLLNIFIACSYLFDIGLEVQYGVFIHAFVLLWFYKWLQLKE